MRRFLVRFVALWILAGLATLPKPGEARAQTAGSSRANFAQAREMFERLADRDRNELYLMLIATGDFSAMASNQFGGRLYDAIASFQAKNGLDVTGVITPETFAKLNPVGGRIFNSWGFTFLDHPSANAAIVIPSRLHLTQTTTPRGLAFEGRNHAISIDFSFFPANEAGMAEVFTRLTQPSPGRHVELKVIKPTFFAVSGGTDTTSFYSRYIPVAGGIAGFTINWNTAAYPNAGRLAIVMANELFPRHMVDQAQSETAFDPGSADDAMVTSRGGFGSEATPLNGTADAPVSPDQQRALDDQLRAVQQAKEDEARRVLEQQQKAQQDAKDLVDKAEREERQRVEQRQYRLTEDRFRRAVAAATTAIEDASAFTAARPDNPHLLDYAQLLGELKATLAGNDPDATDRRAAALAAVLDRDADYLKFAAQRAEERRRKYAQDLGDTTRILKQQRAFLVGVIARDPTGLNAGALLPLVRRADATVGTGNLERAQTLAGEIELAIQRAGLGNDYRAAREADAAAEAAEASRAAAAARLAQLPSNTPERAAKDDLVRPTGP